MKEKIFVMNNISRNLALTLFVVFASLRLFGVESVDTVNYKKAKLKQTTAGCAPAAGFSWLDINNVRARINTGGDMWWDFRSECGHRRRDFFWLTRSSPNTSSNVIPFFPF